MAAKILLLLWNICEMCGDTYEMCGDTYEKYIKKMRYSKIQIVLKYIL